MARLLLLLKARACLFWFVAPFTWPNSLICWCLWSCSECVTTSVTSSGYCETSFVKTAFIKPLPNRETETLLRIISCSPVHLSVKDIPWDFLFSVNSSWAPLKVKELLLLTFVGFGSAPQADSITTFKPGRKTAGYFSLCQLLVRVGWCLCQTSEETISTWGEILPCSTAWYRLFLHGKKWV